MAGAGELTRASARLLLPTEPPTHRENGSGTCSPLDLDKSVVVSSIYIVNLCHPVTGDRGATDTVRMEHRLLPMVAMTCWRQPVSRGRPSCTCGERRVSAIRSLRHCRDTLLRSLTLLCNKVDRGGYQGPYPAHRSSESRTSAHLTGSAARDHVQALLRRDTPHSLYPERVEHTVARSLS
jgi:hypothetical protein